MILLSMGAARRINTGASISATIARVNMHLQQVLVQRHLQDVVAAIVQRLVAPAEQPAALH